MEPSDDKEYAMTDESPFDQVRKDIESFAPAGHKIRVLALLDACEKSDDREQVVGAVEELVRILTQARDPDCVARCHERFHECIDAGTSPATCAGRLVICVSRC